MKKHLALKACVLLVVMFFHSFVLVPKSYATTWEGVAGRLAFRALSPAAISGLTAGSGIIVGVALGVGIGYIAYKSGAITALKNWWNSNIATAPLSQGQVISWTYNGVAQRIESPDGIHYNYYRNGSLIWAYTNYAQLISDIGSFYGQGSKPPNQTIENFTDTMDYGSQLFSSQPSFPANTVYATPRTAPAVSGSAPIVSVQTATDGDIDKFIAGSGATPVASDGTQVGNPPTTDNTVTAGDTASIGLLQEIINYVSNLVGIKDNAQSIRQTLDNSLVVQQQMSAKLDNVGSFPPAAQSALDNISLNTSVIPAKLDNVLTGVQSVDNAIRTSAATSTSIQTRIDALKTAASTKFPFSLASSLSVSEISGSSSYEFAPLPLTPSISVTINPMAGPLHDLFVWIRQMLVWFFWVGTLFAMLKRGMQM